MANHNYFQHLVSWYVFLKNIRLCPKCYDVVITPSLIIGTCLAQSLPAMPCQIYRAHVNDLMHRAYTPPLNNMCIGLPWVATSKTGFHDKSQKLTNLGSLERTVISLSVLRFS